ncbi:hypothetical protein NK553_17615 [Pseudomonas sp. ZM23]|uniref:Uncharacterized protein n=1 Tax=Pseudomonas triclosanedens TaxID=2961893 RepID=A0ABY7A407_9PSED|nr:hypothetical protein [Pseudomonas triclosanedens]MCP8465770.1 hypothetical protein [Pseudomonas triclosanedens]MCP8471265.1 hypothetical protein [Pseudomonas triclosanedens]MCP8477069.1 hypothetical protein [Pseudomonas triclosanedens]WAI51823.1 hypothetical protein OU419_11425 [Pseudomonas triclosanedens]
MQARYRLVLKHPAPGFGTRLEFPALYRQTALIERMFAERGLAPLRQFVCPPGPASDWFRADDGRRLAHELICCVHRDPQRFDNATTLLDELFMFSEQLEVAYLSGNRWHFEEAAGPCATSGESC